MSSTATTTLLLPVVVFQAPGALILVRPHRLPSLKRGIVGCQSNVRIRGRVQNVIGFCVEHVGILFVSINSFLNLYVGRKLDHFQSVDMLKDFLAHPEYPKARKFLGRLIRALAETLQ